MKQCKKKQPNETEIALRREETAHKREYLSYKRPENERKCVFPLVSQPSLPDARAFLIYKAENDQPSTEEETRYANHVQPAR